MNQAYALSSETKENTLSKFILKAKKKLAGNTSTLQLISSTSPKTSAINYKFVKSNKSKTYQNLKSKVETLLNKSPDCIDPIARLINHAEFDGLSASAKERYILSLSKMYNEILSELEVC